MHAKQRIVIIGATSTIAQHCARLWAAQYESIEFHLVGRDEQKLVHISQDLTVRNPKAICQTHRLDFNDPLTIAKFAAGFQEKIDIVLIAHGWLADQATCQTDLINIKAALDINASSPALFAQAFLNQLQQHNHGTLAVIGSVAGDRGRRSNYIYGAAKGLIERFVEGQQHHVAGLANNRVRVILIKPGPTDTPMTASIKQLGGAKAKTLASVESVASLIVKGIEQGKPVIYAPKKWGLIMWVVRHLPAFIFNKINI
jgi:decaprenylphospho-beta-D-erythro-pentofuranosid-2-ulose 2-reductase